MKRDQLLQACCDATLWLDVLDVDDAAEAADSIVDDIIDHLRRDPEIPKRTYDTWTLALASLRSKIAKDLVDRIDGLADLEQVVEAIVDELAPDEQKPAEADELSDGCT
jgi:hypothetical protein